MQQYSDAIAGYKNSTVLKSFELDIFIPSLNCAIEYDGEIYHKFVEKDKRKDQLCKEAGITLYRIREPNCPQLDSSSVCLNLNSLKNEDLEKAIIKLLKLISNSQKEFDVCIQRDWIEIDKNRYYPIINNSLAAVYPHLIDEWDYSKNGILTPYNVSRASGRKVWWKYKKCGNSWEAIISNRAKGSGCPICASKNAHNRAVERERLKKEKRTKE